MAGPTSSILLQNIPDEIQKGRIYNVLSEISSSREGNDFWVNDTSKIDGTSKTKGQPFGISFDEINEKYYAYDEFELMQIEEFADFMPKFDIGFFAMCNGEIDHRILGELTYFFAKEFDGIIDFDGAIYFYDLLPKEIKKDGIGEFMEKIEWSAILAYHEAIVKEVNGKIHPIEYETINHTTWAYNICDVEFMKNWLKHPRFHMIK